MEGLKAYLISVTAASIICGIVNALAGKRGAVSSVLKLLTGLFLALTVIRPVIRLSLSEIELYLDSISTKADAAVADGEIVASRELASIIKAETEAYILDKAASLGVDLQVDVILSDNAPPLPVEVLLIGAASPYAKAQLSAMIADELGIPKEAQRWTG